MSINLVTVCGHNTTMLRHMLNHYKDMVDEIYVVVYLSSDKDKVLSEVKEITRDLNIDIHKNKRYLLTPLESAKKFVKLI